MDAKMTESLDKLLAQARDVRMSKPEIDEQRVSFAFGTAYIENENVTREMVERAVAEDGKRK